eukprot:TRINITY_DN10388_c0_g1_i8.p1 TRINITY_DN10388_c0_g1~~TRINITY_DN10388_c0_g1_i8.p1  ORF type:complete len:139 (+),score=2.51 TRINITY_DN10388_c0_g1_i8:27-419(+)
MGHETFLFHGSRANHPSMIYKDQFGFDMRYCESGLWGRGIYFATNSAYSDDYAFSLPSGSKQMFLALVVLGHSCLCASDKALRMPPAKQNASGNFAVEHYDSVSAHHNSSLNYIIYENGRAYPFYLITYR